MALKGTFQFYGLMSPVFTSFKDDECQTVQVENIGKYAQYLKNNGVKGILVNGTVGEGPSLTVDERKLVTEHWTIAARKHNLTVMVQIGGASLPDVIELAQHAEKHSVDAVLCLPELFYKPKTQDDLLIYLKRIAQYCETRPFLYYHNPTFSGIDFHMPSFCVAAKRMIRNFAGIKYTSNDLNLGAECLQYADNVFLATDVLFSSGLLLGFKSAILTTLNLYPEVCIKIMNAMEEGDMKQAQHYQSELTCSVRKILTDGNDEWVSAMKEAFNDQKSGSGLAVGATRI